MLKSLLILISLTFSQANASMVLSIPYMVSNANGESFEVKQVGDEHLTYLVSTKDNTIIYFDRTTSNYTHAVYSSTTNSLTHSDSVYTEQALNPGIQVNTPGNPNESDLLAIRAQSQSSVLQMFP